MSKQFTALGLLVCLAGCKGGEPLGPDAGVNLRRVDSSVRSDAVSIPLAVDFTVSGCPRFEATPRCTGAAPLTLEFVPLGTASVTKYLWDFGDGTPKSSVRAPTHTYPFPGTYDVSLVGGGVAGSAPRAHLGFVVVTSNATGFPCDVDQQCQNGLQCVCGSMATAKCTAAFTRGLCASFCSAAPCPATEVCADFSLAASAAVREPWQEPLCVRRCQRDEDCGPGLRCRDLPAASPPGTWVRGCFPGAPASPGGSCRNASGQLRNDACLTGQCLDLGALGACSLDCSTTPCPPGGACAVMTDGRHLCLQRCGPDLACDRDPLLACAAPNAGPLGFVVPGISGGTYCAPKICTSHEDCGPSGSCRDDQNGANCVRKVE